MAPISYLIGRFVVKIPYIGLANIVADRKIVPEFIQGKAESRRIADTAMQILQDSKSYLQMVQDLREIRGKLGESGASARAAKIAVDMVTSSSHGKKSDNSWE
jgi:lipid-A-disaccharide synthase